MYKRQLLHSDDIAATGVALGVFLYEQSQSRWGFGNPLDELAEEILAQARVLLAVEHDPAVCIRDRVQAAWSSAVGVVDHLGDATDLPRLVEVLTAAVAGVDDDPDLGELVEFGFAAVGRCLGDADESTRHRVAAWLAGLFTDERRPERLRVLAIRPLHDSESDIPHGQEEVLAGLLRHDSIQLAGAAAWALVGRTGYDARVREVVAAWPVRGVPAVVDEVRWAIADADEVAEAGR